MSDFTALKTTLEKKGYQVSCFATGAEAADYLDRSIDGKTVGFGGSMTLQTLDLMQRLGTHNTVCSHNQPAPGQDPQSLRRQAMSAEVYLCSANALAESGEIVNIDGCGNRVSGTLFGHQKVYYVIGKNKLAPDLEQAIWRARNIAAPKNAQRLHRKTPCAVKADRCYDCDSPERICRGLVVLYQKMTSCAAEVVLIDEELGY